MDIKNPAHPSTKYQRPLNLYSEVKEVTYHNGFYPEKILTYDAQDNPIIESTWQHKMVNITKWSLIGIALCFVASRCGIEKLLYHKSDL